MEGIWEVSCNGEPMGQCQVTREGLYHRFRCRCRLPDGQIRCLILRVGDWERSLGVLVPGAGTFGLDTRIASRQLPQGTPVFTARIRREALEGTFVPIHPEEPFAYLTRLENAYLARRNGETGVVLETKE